VGKSDYAVIKNEPKEIVIKQFCNETMPTAYSVTYPYKEKDNDPRNYFLLEFNNGWKIRVRIHNASSRIFKSNGEVFATEKMDPICINIDTLIWVRSVAKK
jgi:predicted transposase YbfD/YdcC